MVLKKRHKTKPIRRNPAERGWDVIDELAANVGKVRSKGSARPGEEGYYGELYRSANRGAGRQVFSPTGQSPDSAVDALRRSGSMPEDSSVDDLWEAIERASGARKATRRYDNPERQAERFASALGKRERAKCKKLIPAEKLKVGQKFSLAGSPFRVQRIDPDSLDVDVIDGERFGRQTIPDGAVIPADKVCPAPTPRKSLRRIQHRQKHRAAQVQVSRAKPGLAPSKSAKRVGKRRVPFNRLKRGRKNEHARQADLRYLLRRRKPARVRPVNFVGVRIGSKVRVLKVMGSALRSVGTFTGTALKAWAERHGVKLGK